MKYYAGVVASIALLTACAVLPIPVRLPPLLRLPPDVPERAGSRPPPPRSAPAEEGEPTLAGRPVERADPDAYFDPVDLESLTEDVLAEANYARYRAGAPPLAADPLLTRAARRYSRELAGRREIEHVSSTDGRETFRDRIEAEGARARIAGENLARLTSTRSGLSERVVQLWLESPGHRHNLLDPIFRRTGIGVWLGRDGIWYVVQVYATAT